jgi:MHS family shikimate/dehydroshikimate transporter-like MFS transporter
MERLGGEDTGIPTAIRKVVVASFIGTTIERYDYFIYGTAAALVFPALFFPEFSPLAGTLACFATFAVGFAARPLGGVIFGHYGDKIGRKAMLGLWTFPFFWLLNTQSPLLIILAVVVGLAVAHAAVYGTQASFYAELFGTRVRYSGASFSMPQGHL